MQKILHSLTTKLIVSFMALILLSSGLTFGFTFNATRDALKDSLKDQVVAISQQIATRIDGDEVLALKEGDEETERFIEIRDTIFNARKLNPDIAFTYIMVKTGNDVIFKVDDAYGDEEDAATIDMVYEDADIVPIDAALGGTASASEDFYTDAWGTFLSGYAPIYNSEGYVVAVLGVDMTADHVIEKQDFIGGMIYYVIGATVVFAALIIAIFAGTIIRDIKKLNAAANAISMGDNSVEVNVRRKDEIGELADSFGRMIASLKIMMSMKQNSTPEKTEENKEA